MRARSRFACIAIVLTVFCLPSLAPAQLITGVPPLGTTGSSTFDSVNLANLDVHFAIPIFSRQGRGVQFTYNLAYDSLIWAAWTNSVRPGYEGWYPIGTSPAGGTSNWGWQGTTSAATGYVWNKYQQVTLSCGTVEQWTNFVYYDPQGSAHPFDASKTIQHVDSGTCTNSTFPSANAIDNSGYILHPGAVTPGQYSLPTTVISSRGLTITPPPSDTMTGNGMVQDSNGNTLSVTVNGNTTSFSDMLGTALTIDTTHQPNYVTYSYPGPNGSVTTKVSYAAYTVQTSFQVPDARGTIGEFGPTQEYLVSRIDLPDETSYQFTYEPTMNCVGGCAQNAVTGRLAAITVPTGGTIQYSYVNSGCLNQDNCMTSSGSPSNMLRTLGGGGWQYAILPQGSANPKTQVIDPANNETDITFSGVYETSRSVYNGPASAGNILDYSYICYNGQQNQGESTCPNATVSTPLKETAQIDHDNSVSFTSTSSLIDTIYDCNSNPTNCYGNVTTVSNYDYGRTPLSKKIINYDPNLCTHSNVCNRPQNIEIQDGGQARKAYTTYVYDGGNDTAGNPTSVSKWVNPNLTLTWQYTYGTGGVLAAILDPNQTQTTYNYAPGTSCNGSFPTSISAPSTFTNGNLTLNLSYNCSGGMATSIQDFNGNTISQNYADAYYWRPTSSANLLTPVTNYSYDSPTQYEAAMTFSVGSNQSTTDNLVETDSLGRPTLKQRHQGPSSSYYDTVQTSYDSVGHATVQTYPFVSMEWQGGSNEPGVTTTFDALNRPTFVSDSNGATTTYCYNLNSTLVFRGPAPVGENTKAHVYTYDALGRLTAVLEVTGTKFTQCPSSFSGYSGSTTTYSYDPLGNLLTVNQTSESRAFTYDGLGRLTSEFNPETTLNGSGGLTNYSYDSDSTCGTSYGDKVKRIDPAGNVTCYSWDGLHRLTSVTYTGSGPNISNTADKHYIYDLAQPLGQTFTSTNPLGRMVYAYTCSHGNQNCTSQTNQSTWTGYAYDALGRTTTSYESAPGIHSLVYQTVNQLAANGSVTSRVGNILNSGPFTVMLNYTLDGEGRPVSGTENGTNNGWYPAATYNVFGEPNELYFYPSTDREQFTWDNFGRMQTWTSAVGAGLQAGTLNWNPNGSLGSLQVNDSLNPGNTQNCTYAYDDLARISSVHCGTPWVQDFTYDAYGNVQKSGTSSWQPAYSTNNHANLLGYDAMGNVTTDQLLNQFSYDAEGRPVSVNGRTILFDAFNRELAYQSPAANTWYTIIHAPDGYKFAKMNGTSPVQYTFPLAAGAKLVYNSQGLQYYQHSDWVGSSRVASTPGQLLYYDGSYGPFGESYAEIGTTARLFTGQTQDALSGLYDFTFRQYSPVQGRWMVPDPAGRAAVDIANPQTWNRYAYVANGPLNNVDPLGLYLYNCNYDDSCDDPYDWPDLPDPGFGGGQNCAVTIDLLCVDPGTYPDPDPPGGGTICSDSHEGIQAASPKQCTKPGPPKTPKPPTTPTPSKSPKPPAITPRQQCLTDAQTAHDNTIAEINSRTPWVSEVMGGTFGFLTGAGIGCLQNPIACEATYGVSSAPTAIDAGIGGVASGYALWVLQNTRDTNIANNTYNQTVNNVCNNLPDE